MAFQQLYYTSCEHGLAGYGGYQFNAITPGVPPVVLREVEERTVYEPPRWLQADPCPDEPEAYPVALSYGMSEATGTAIVTNVVFTGADYSGRPGNYFVHALVDRDAGAGLRSAAAGRAMGGGAVAQQPGRRHRTAGTAGAARARRHRPPGRPGVPRRARGRRGPARAAHGRGPGDGRSAARAGGQPRRDRERLVDRGRLVPAGRAPGAPDDVHHLQPPAQLRPLPPHRGPARHAAARRGRGFPAVRPRRREDAGRRRPSAGRPARGHRGDGDGGTVAAGHGLRHGGGGRSGRLAGARRGRGGGARPAAVRRRGGRRGPVAARRGRLDTGPGRRRRARRRARPAGGHAGGRAARGPARPGPAAARPGPGRTPGTPADRPGRHAAAAR